MNLSYKTERAIRNCFFSCLGYQFHNDGYFLPHAAASNLVGDVAIASTAGNVWPMKRWAFYDQLKNKLEDDGHVVNFLPSRRTLLEHIADVQSHKCLVSGDTLPMHIALGSGMKCVTLFQCTSPWEIHDYGLQTKIISPCLRNIFTSGALTSRPRHAYHSTSCTMTTQICSKSKS